MVDYPPSVDAFEVVPGERIGPFRIAMTRDEAAAEAEAAGVPLERTMVRALPGGETWIVDQQVFVYFDQVGRANAIEAALRDGKPVTWLGMPLDSAAREVVAAFDAIAEADRTDREYPASTCYPQIGLCLWMDAKPGAPLGGVFESVLVRRPESTDIAAR